MEPAALGEQMHRLVERLYPLCRSITGDGVRATLDVLAESIPLTVYEIPTGTHVLDWTVPKEWNIRDAYVADAKGRRVIDFRESNLHVVGYSTPIRTTMSLTALREHLHTLADQPDLIPYRTSYYKEAWGFCLSQKTLDSLPDGDYEVVIDSTLAEGSLTYAEHIVRGQVSDEVLLSCHICHPSLANDNLAAIAVAVELAKRLAEAKPYYTYRFLFAPGTIGAITFLARNFECIDKIKHGLVLACAGDSGSLTYKRSRRGDAEIDQVAELVLESSGRSHKIVDFSPYGYDERQYCSPGFNLAVGSLTRTPYGRYPEYHTSADNLNFVKPEALEGSLRTYLAVMDVLEGNRRYLNLNPKCEPQLGRRGLYRTIGGDDAGRARELALLWVLNLSDGEHGLLDIAERSGMSFAAILEAAAALLEVGLLREIGEES
jgi:aminopeptidase-like protein